MRFLFIILMLCRCVPEPCYEPSQSTITEEGNKDKKVVFPVGSCVTSGDGYYKKIIGPNNVALQGGTNLSESPYEDAPLHEYWYGGADEIYYPDVYKQVPCPKWGNKCTSKYTDKFVQQLKDVYNFTCE